MFFYQTFRSNALFFHVRNKYDFFNLKILLPVYQVKILCIIRKFIILENKYSIIMSLQLIMFFNELYDLRVSINNSKHPYKIPYLILLRCRLLLTNSHQNVSRWFYYNEIASTLIYFHYSKLIWWIFCLLFSYDLFVKKYHYIIHA